MVELSSMEKLNVILKRIFGETLNSLFSVFLNKSGSKLYLPLHQSVKGLVNTPTPFDFFVDVREDKTVIHF